MTANCWYALFHADYPFYFNAYRHGGDLAGAPALSILRSAGFRIHVYSQDELVMGFFDQREFVYGQGGALIDEAVVEPDTFAAGDRNLVRKLAAALRSRPQGRNLFVLYLESAHHDYFWPADFVPPFRPYTERVDYMGSVGPAELALIRNRYLNSVRYVDDLFAELMAALRDSGLYEEAVIAVNGDHGEEFYEHGSLLHGSNLRNPQVTPYLAMRLPRVGQRRDSRVVSQLNLLPTVVDYVGLGAALRPYVAGRSMLGDELRTRYAVVAQARGALVPSRYAIQDGRYKLIFDLEGSPDRSGELVVHELLDADDNNLVPGKGSLEEYDRFVREHFWPYLADLGFLRMHEDKAGL